jgi:hypothetical protein
MREVMLGEIDSLLRREIEGVGGPEDKAKVGRRERGGDNDVDVDGMVRWG